MTTAIITRNPPTQYVLLEPPRYFVIGRRKVYLTAQAYYSGVSYRVRMGVVRKAKEWIAATIGRPEPMPRLSLRLKFQGKMKDLDNRGYFWSKVILDYLVAVGTIPDDDIAHVPEIRFNWADGQDLMEIALEEI